MRRSNNNKLTIDGGDSDLGIPLSTTYFSFGGAPAAPVSAAPPSSDSEDEEEEPRRARGWIDLIGGGDGAADGIADADAVAPCTAHSNSERALVVFPPETLSTALLWFLSVLGEPALEQQLLPFPSLPSSSTTTQAVCRQLYLHSLGTILSIISPKKKSNSSSTPFIW